MEYYNVHRRSRGSVSQFKGGVHVAGVKSVLFTSICGLKTLACRKGDVGYRWNFFAVATFVSLPALQGLHQPREKELSQFSEKSFQLYWEIWEERGTYVFYQTRLFTDPTSKKKKKQDKDSILIRVLPFHCFIKSCAFSCRCFEYLPFSVLQSR